MFHFKPNNRIRWLITLDLIAQLNNSADANYLEYLAGQTDLIRVVVDNLNKLTTTSLIKGYALNNLSTNI